MTRTKREASISFWKGTLYVLIGVVGWLVLGWFRMRWDASPTWLQWCGILAMLTIDVLLYIKFEADEANLTMRSWIRRSLQ